MSLDPRGSIARSGLLAPGLSRSLVQRVAQKMVPAVDALCEDLRQQGAPPDELLFVRIERPNADVMGPVHDGVVRTHDLPEAAGTWCSDQSAALGELLDEVRGVGLLLSRLELSINSASGTWSAGFERLVTESQVRPFRSQLDGRVFRAMLTSAGDSWSSPGEKTLTLGSQRTSGTSLNLITATERRELAVGPELAGLVTAVRDLYERYGRTLPWPEWEIEGAPDDYELHSVLVYRLHQVTDQALRACIDSPST